MPPKATVSRQQVLQAAFEVARTDGFDAISARRVAQELGCSTQPVYRAYRSMEELKKGVLEKAEQVASSYLLGECRGDLPFLQIGLGSLRFAKEEPHLFKAVSLSGPVLRDIQQGKPPPDFVVQRMRAEPMLANLTDEQLAQIHALMWFFSQGLTTLFLTEMQMETDPMELAEKYLQLAGRAVIKLEANRRPT